MQVDAGLQDAPLLRCADGRAMAASVPVDQWVLAHENYLTLTAAPLEGAQAPAEIELSLWRAGDDAALAFLGWRLPHAAQFEALHLTVPFDPGMAPTTQLPGLDPESDLTEEAFAAGACLVIELVAAFERAELDTALRLLEFRMSEFACAFETPFETHRDVVRGDLGALLGDARYRTVSLAKDQVRLSPCCGGRLFHATRVSGDEAVIFEGIDGARQTMAVYVGKVGATWRIVR
jgi:hypothetical protein